MAQTHRPLIPIPPFRKLRGYAFDPSLSLQIDTVAINQILYKVPWEDLEASPREQEKQSLNPGYVMQSEGPVGEYVEVIDFDPTVKKYYRPVDLNQNYILAQDGLDPSESNPLFHQQMVYAVAMTTITNFEKALGRKVLWAPRLLADRTKYEEYVQRLRIYPHALRDANAYYSPAKKALLFGYFSSTPANETLHMPNSLVFTCLSHDIVAHETTHAILDGMYRHFNEATNPDVLAFHEAFADIVALFQHFTFPDVLKHQIAKTRGDLGEQNILGQLAQEFGSAIGSYGSLRDAIGEYETVKGEKKWRPKKPSPNDYRTVMEPHERGSILVAAVFEAFITIYKSRIEDLLRIASNGTGILPQGELNPDLVNRLSDEAAKSAGHVLNMCIRALDYCPPVDLNFGDYLRAIITADADLVADDNRGYRLAFIDAFRKRGIYPSGIKTLSVESLGYNVEPFVSNETRQLFGYITTFLAEYREKMIAQKNREAIYNISKDYVGGNDTKDIKGLHKRIFTKFEDSAEFEELTGLVFNLRWADFGIRTSTIYDEGRLQGPSFQIQNLRLVSRVGPDGDQINQIIFSMVQRSGVLVENGVFAGHFLPHDDHSCPENGFELRGGCTLIFDLDTLQLKYAIAKPLYDPRAGRINLSRVESQYRYQYDEGLLGISEYQKYFCNGISQTVNEPFALLHQH